jgi:hypothetical protein
VEHRSDRSRLESAVDGVQRRVRVVGEAALRRNPGMFFLALTRGEKGVVLDRRRSRREPGNE